MLRRAPLALLLLAACSGGDAATDGPVARGARIYANACSPCHGGDPTQGGAVGPAIAGSSHELVYARVVEGTYPPGYEPKRPGGVMQPLPHLKDYVPDIVAYLQSLPTEGGRAADAGS